MASVNFADVKKIVIPEGDVRRITQTSDGTVLWEKTADYTYVVQGDWWLWTNGSGYTCRYVQDNLWNGYPYYRVRIEEPVTIPASAIEGEFNAASGTISVDRLNSSGSGISSICLLSVTSDGSTLTVKAVDTGWKNKISSTGSYPWMGTNYSSIGIGASSRWFNFLTKARDIRVIMNSLKIIVENANYPY